MTNKLEIYKCSICGNTVEVLHAGKGTLVCCGQDMNLMVEHKAGEEGKEKHVPVIEGSSVNIGSIPHPMEEDHYIEWIELTMDTGRIIRKFLKPGNKPSLEFCCGVVSARAYCNVHGLWKS